MFSRFNFGALTVVIENPSGRVAAILHRLSNPARNASELFSPAYINAAVQHARLAWESTADR